LLQHVSMGRHLWVGSWFWPPTTNVTNCMKPTTQPPPPLIQGMRLAAGEELVSMIILSPAQTESLKQQQAALAAAEGADDEETDGEAEDAGRGRSEEVEESKGGPEDQGPWMVVVTAKGIGEGS
jgi:hypothetical protein